MAAFGYVFSFFEIDWQYNTQASIKDDLSLNPGIRNKDKDEKREGTKFRIYKIRDVPSPAPVVSAETAHKTFGATDLMSTYSVCTQRVFGGIESRTQALRSAVRCSNH
ncbi:hypothetical protein TNCV_1140631 [Trichonephila clavipes]|nr:hypothetical protein TNCV_1140631 [Trichonephila clavipes]